jgi:PD-(D/E)XK nuclease superfamily
MTMPLQPEQPIETFTALIKGDDAPANRCPQATADGTQHDIERFTTLLDGFRQSRTEWEAKQVKSADEFSLFRVMDVEEDEVTHSKLLAWLLDRRIEKGSHAQGNLGFRYFIEELGPELGAKPSPQIMSYPDQPYWVRCEVRGKKSRVDIEIAASGRFIIHIENKIKSQEDKRQTHREWWDLEKRRQELGVPASNVHAVFLTLDGHSPKNKHFVAIGWHRLVRVFERFAERCEPPEVRLFVTHYAEAVRRLALIEPEAQEHANENSSI